MTGHETPTLDKLAKLRDAITDGVPQEISYFTPPKGPSLSWPAERMFEEEELEIVGDLHPELVHMGKSGSSLMAALAVAINSVRHTRVTEDTFRRLSAANREPATRADSPKHITETLRAVQNTVLPFWKMVDIEPLVPDQPKDLSESSPLPMLIEALRSGSAVVFPVRLDGEHLDDTSKRYSHAGRQFWGAVTGYEEKIVTPDPEADLAKMPVKELAFLPIRTEYTIAIPLQRLGIIAPSGADLLTEQLDDGRSAQVVSPR